MQIQKTSQLKNPKLNLLVYGKPGAGKTRFSGTCAPRFKPLILSAESGLLSLKALKDANGKPIDFDFLQIEKFEQLSEVYNSLKFGKLDYDTVVMDSITEIQQVCMDKILREEKIEKARIQDWGTLNLRMVNLIRAFRDLDKNLIVTALSDTITDEETGTNTMAPLVQGKLKETLAGYFDEVFYAFSKEGKNPEGKVEVKHYLQTRNTQKAIAKDRSGQLPAIVAPDFCAIYDLIHKGE
jgi:phage nucleotide-binding protein